MEKYFVKKIEDKLMLCSRDIQVGDKIWDTLGNMWLEVNNSFALKLYKEKICDHWVKVIGEISSDALSYVKEGDEFEESQVSIKMEVTMLQDGHKVILSYDPAKNKVNEINCKLIAFIECPTCKKLH